MAVAGSIQPIDLGPRHVLLACSSWNRNAPATRYQRHSGLREVLRHLSSVCQTIDLSGYVPRVSLPKPRNVVVSDAQRGALLAAAPLYMRCWLLLCSDLAIRSGTAALVSPRDYDAGSRTLRITTKFGAKLTLPVTAELAQLIELCPLPDAPCVAQLHDGLRSTLTVGAMRRQWVRLRHRLGITASIRPHDLRRTTAVKAYELTRDLRLVQALLGHRNLRSTLHYLDHDATPVPLSVLELAKLNPQTKGVQ